MPPRPILAAMVAAGMLAVAGMLPGETARATAPAEEIKAPHKQPETFEEFVAKATRPMKPEEAAAAAGNYQRYCALCHGDDRQGHVNDDAPSLRSTSLIASGYLGALEWAISYGRIGTAMGGYLDEVGGPMTVEEIGQLNQWLREKADVKPIELPRELVKGDASAGKEIYATHCASCHGASGEGGIGTALGNPTMLALTADPFLRHAIEHGRDGTPMPAFKDTLGSADIDNVTAFLRSRSSGWKIENVALQQPPAFDDYILNKQGGTPDLELRDGMYVSAATLDRELKAKRRLVLLDTRVMSRWQQGHIEGAVPLPYYSNRDQVLAALPRDATWIVAYCECPRAAAESVVKRLRKEGLEHTAVLWEGFQGWVSLGYPSTAGAVPATAITTLPPGKDVRD